MPRRRNAAIATAIVLIASGCGGGGDTSPPPTPSVKIVAAGDIADCGGRAPGASAAARTAALVAPDDAVVLTLGDNTYPVGAHAEFTDCYHPTWGAFKSRTRPAPGNHDYATPDADGYFAYFGTQAGPDRRGYYSFDIGGWHVVSLNSNVDADTGSAQMQWLAADLAQSRDTLCTIAVWHHPVTSSGLHGNDPKMTAVLSALHAAGVDIVLNGHDHGYERFARQDPGGAADSARGIRSFVVGTGGAPLYAFPAPRPNSEVRYAGDHGVLRLFLEAEGYRWAFVRAGNGSTFDSGSDRCHR